MILTVVMIVDVVVSGVFATKRKWIRVPIQDIQTTVLTLRRTRTCHIVTLVTVVSGVRVFVVGSSAGRFAVGQGRRCFAFYPRKNPNQFNVDNDLRLSSTASNNFSTRLKQLRVK